MKKREEGWGKLINSAKWHYFKKDGRSLCGKWLSLGEPIWDQDTDPTVKTPDSCLACYTKFKKLETTNA